MRAVNTRLEDETERGRPRGRWALWIVLLVVLGGGVVLALRNGMRITPLIETVR